MQWHTQAKNIATDLKVKVYFTLSTLNAENFVAWNCRVDESAKGRYDMILGQDILTELVLNLKFSEHIIQNYDGPIKGSTVSAL